MINRKLLQLTILVNVMASSVSFAEQCVINAIGAPQLSRQDWINPKVKTDYYLLALSWSPQHCYNKRNGRRHKFQCKLNNFGFVVHGLWPQSAQAQNRRGHPRFCNTTRRLTASLIRQYICIVPGEQLMQSQWDKHGNCAFQTADQYFSTIATLWKAVKRPDIKTMGSQRYTVGSLKKLMVSLNTPNLRADHIRIRLNRSNYLREIFICYDKKFRFTSCKNKSARNDRAIKIALPR